MEASRSVNRQFFPLQGWLFLVLISIFELILAFVSVLGKTSLSAMIPTILVSGIILLYCLYPGTKAAFGADKLAQPAPLRHHPQSRLSGTERHK